MNQHAGGPSSGAAGGTEPVTTPPLVPDVVEIDVPVGGRVLVVSGLQLERDATPASLSATVELAQVLHAWTGPGVLVLNGDLFELLATEVVNPRQALASHQRLTRAVQSFCEGGARQVVVLPGSRDARLGCDEGLVRLVHEELCATVGLAAELRVATGCGSRPVRVEPGHQFDPRHAFGDPRNPADTPLGYHIVKEVMPALGAARATWLAGAERIRDRVDLPRFAASRLVYRRLVRYLPWLLAPFALALLLKFPIVFALFPHHRRGFDPWSRRLVEIGITTAVDLVLVAAAVYVLTRRAWASVSGVALGARGLAQNDDARNEARRLILADHAGLVTGHTHRPELTHLGPGFYANCGCATEVVDQYDARLGLPPVFLAHRELSWVELEAGAELHVRLLRAGLDLPGGTVVERLVARRGERAESRPVVVATFPQGESWPGTDDPRPRLRRVRRRAAVAVALAGLLDLVSALVPPLRPRLAAVDRMVPLAVPQTATALVAFSGLGLLLLARGIRRGQRHAWTIAATMLLGSSVLHLVKGIDVEEAAIALAVALYLLVHRMDFQAAVDRPSLRRGLVPLVASGAGTIAIATAAVELFHGRRSRPSLGRAVQAVAERVVGVHSVGLAHRLDRFLSPALLAVGVGLALSTGWLAFRPVVSRQREASTGTGLARARDVVRRHGHGTLDYFALRSDKEYFYSGGSMVAYAVYGGVCLVSPDPIGPATERDQVWSAFRQFADERGWAVTVMGASEDWLPVYRGTGMHDLYMGDEAVVDVHRFSLEGGRNKGLRQAVNRVAKYGYTISFHDPARLDSKLRQQLSDVMTKSRQGDVERGFSMTLGRIFDPEDEGLLLAVCSDRSGVPVAFCQYVPAPGIDGYSLDLMRRDLAEHPNGLLDFAVVETIHHVREHGGRGLGLNFATMRAVLAGEAGDNFGQRVEGWLLRRLSGSMQIESLWRFNAKYDPDWQPRYAVYDSPETLLPSAVAIARAESFWELPLIGRFLVPSSASPSSPAEAAPPGDAEEVPSRPT